MEKTVPINAIIPTPIAVSSSFVFTIGETAAIAAAPQTPVPIPSNREIEKSAFNYFASSKVIPIENTIVPISRINNGIP